LNARFGSLAALANKFSVGLQDDNQVNPELKCWLIQNAAGNGTRKNWTRRGAGPGMLKSVCGYSPTSWACTP